MIRKSLEPQAPLVLLLLESLVLDLRGRVAKVDSLVFPTANGLPYHIHDTPFYDLYLAGMGSK